MKIKQLGLLLGLALIFTNNVYALSVADYKLLKNSDFSLLETHINGVGQGYSWSNTIVEHKMNKKLYCPPQKIALNSGNFLSIIDKEIESGRWKEQDPFEFILFIGLEKTFPC